MICVVLLQNCVGFVQGETGYYSETCVTCDGDGTEEGGIKAIESIYIKEEFGINVEEETVDINDEIQEAIPFPPVTTEHEVRLRGVCVSWWQLMFLGQLLHSKKKLRNCT